MTASELTALTAPPVPVPTKLTQFYWDAVARHELQILRCQTCGHYIHYPRILCDVCQSEDVAPETVSGRGTLYSYTWTMQAFHPYFVDKLPYLVAVVELEEEPGLKMTSSILGVTREQVQGGMPLEVVFHEVAPGLTLPYFRPATGATS